MTDFSLCENCLELRNFSNHSSHFWWHTLLPIGMRDVKGVKLVKDIPHDPRIEIPPVMEPDSKMIQEDMPEQVDIVHVFSNDVERRFADVVQSLNALESKIVSLRTVVREPPKAEMLSNDETIPLLTDVLGDTTCGSDQKVDDFPTAEILDQDDTSQNANSPKMVDEGTHAPQDMMSIQLSKLESRMDVKMSSLEGRISGLELKIDELLKGFSIILSSIPTK